MPPTVQRYGGPRIQRLPIPAARQTASVTPLALGANVDLEQANTSRQIAQFTGTLGEQFAGEFAQRIEEERRANDETFVLEMDNKLAEFAATEELRVRALKGKAAFEEPEKVNAAFIAHASALEKQLTNDRQRLAFRAASLRRERNLDYAVRSHTDQQMQAYEASEFEAGLKNHVRDALTYAKEPKLIQQELALAIDLIERKGPRMGMGPEEVQGRIEGLRSAVHVGVIGQLLDQNLITPAQLYFEEAKGQIKGEALGDVEKALRQGTVDDQSRREAEKILAAGGTLEEQLERAKAIEDTKVYDATKSRLINAQNVKDAEAKRADDAFLDDIYARLEGEKGRYDPSPQERTRLGTRNASFDSYKSSLLSEKAIRTSDEGWVRFWQLAEMAQATPDRFLQQDLWSEKRRMGQNEINRLMAYRLEIMGEMAKAAVLKKKPADTLDGTDARVSAVFNDAWTRFTGRDARLSEAEQKADPELAKRIANMRTLVSTEVELLPKAAKSDDIRHAVDNIFSQSVVTPGQPKWFGIGVGPSTVGFTYGAKPTTKHIWELTIADVPAEAKAEIAVEMRKHGLAVNDETILYWYLVRLAKR